METNSIIIRTYNEEQDKNFIFSTFLRGMYYGQHPDKRPEKDQFMRTKDQELKKVIKNSIIKVACFKDGLDVILSYVILSKDESVLHFVFTKKAWRKIGLTKLLLNDKLKSVSSLTTIGSAILKNRRHITYNPALFKE